MSHTTRRSRSDHAGARRRRGRGPTPQPVDTSVRAGVPVAERFHDVLARRRDGFLDFVASRDDATTVARVLRAVRDATGTLDIETEQCREQEQARCTRGMTWHIKIWSLNH